MTCQDQRIRAKSKTPGNVSGRFIIARIGKMMLNTAGPFRPRRIRESEAPDDGGNPPVPPEYSSELILLPFINRQG
jgi:hypothetical protein